MADFALELSLDAEGESAVVAQWRALRAAGLPSQADHRSMTNAPHVTLVAAAHLGPDARDAGAALVLPLLPAVLVVRGLLVLGEGSRVTLAHLVEPPAALADAVAELRRSSAVRGGGPLRHPVWTPHLTLARRMARADVPRALDVLAGVPVPRVVASRLRWWDPVSGIVAELGA